MCGAFSSFCFPIYSRHSVALFKNGSGFLFGSSDGFAVG